MTTPVDTMIAAEWNVLLESQVRTTVVADNRREAWVKAAERISAAVERAVGGQTLSDEDEQILLSLADTVVTGTVSGPDRNNPFGRTNGG